MAMSMKEKASQSHVKTEWPAALKTEFAREAEKPNGCVGSELLSETEKLRVWTIRLKPGERIGFHRHVLNYFWTVGERRARPPAPDGRHHDRIHLLIRARRATRSTAPASSRCTIWRTSATRT